MRHLLFACSLWIVLPATIQAQVETASAAGIHHTSDSLPALATWGHWEQMDFLGMPLEIRRPGVTWQQSPQANRERSTRRKVLGSIVGGVGGFFGGMVLGAVIEGHRCDCDDPGLLGALIGAPVGGVAGAVLGFKLLF